MNNLCVQTEPECWEAQQDLLLQTSLGILALLTGADPETGDLALADGPEDEDGQGALSSRDARKAGKCLAGILGVVSRKGKGA